MEKRKIEVSDNPSFYQEVYEYGDGNPKVMVTGGIHGDEVTGIYVAQKLIKYFNDCGPIKGSLKIMPKCNPVATRQMKRRAFYDEIDMNRIFPGNKSSSPTMRAAHNIWQESENMDIIIDIHCCSSHSMMYALAIYDEFPKVECLIKSLTIQNLVQSEGVEGQFFTELCRKRGQKAFIIELPSANGKGAINFDAAKECFEALLNLFRCEGIIKGDSINKPPTSYGKIKDVLAKNNGLWIPQVKNGDNLIKGDIIGNINGRDIAVPEDGTVLITIPGSYLFTDDCLLSYIQEK